MAAPTKSSSDAFSSNTAPSGGVSSRFSWQDLEPKEVDFEDAMNAAKVKAVWSDMYRRAGLRAPDEKTQAAFRFAVYVYALKNGTSREGDYVGTFTMFDGTRVDASVIPQATGKMLIRKFFRGNAAESYEALKSSAHVKSDGKLVARAAELQASGDQAFAMADWLGGYEGMTPAEAKINEEAFRRGLSKAARSRGAKTLEQVEKGRVEETMEVQGPGYDRPVF